jgi:hypothetical protein
VQLIEGPSPQSEIRADSIDVDGRIAVAHALIQRPRAKEINAALAPLVLAEQGLDPGTRAEIASFLAAGSAATPANADVLRKALKSERSRAVIAAILNGIPAGGASRSGP